MEVISMSQYVGSPHFLIPKQSFIYSPKSYSGFSKQGEQMVDSFIEVSPNFAFLFDQVFEKDIQVQIAYQSFERQKELFLLEKAPVSLDLVLDGKPTKKSTDGTTLIPDSETGFKPVQRGEKISLGDPFQTSGVVVWLDQVQPKSKFNLIQREILSLREASTFEATDSKYEDVPLDEDVKVKELPKPKDGLSEEDELMERVKGMDFPESFDTFFSQSNEKP